MAKAKLAAVVTLNTSAFSRGLASMRRGFARFHASVISPIGRFTAALFAVGAAAVTAAAAGIAVLIEKTAAYGDNIGKMAKRTGLTTDFIQKLKHAAELGGNTVDDMEKAVRKLAQSATDADAGLKTYTREFDKLGVGVRDTEGELKSTEQLLIDVTNALAQTENATERVSIASKLLGRAGTRILPMLADGANGFAAAMREAEELGLIMTPEQVRAAEQFRDEMLRTKGIFAGISRSFGSALLPAINTALITFQQTLKELRESGFIALAAEKLGYGAAMLLAAGEVIAKSPDRFGVLFDIIVTAFETGAKLAGLAIKQAFLDNSFVSKARAFYGYLGHRMGGGSEDAALGYYNDVLTGRIGATDPSAVLAEGRAEMAAILRRAAGGGENWAALVDKYMQLIDRAGSLAALARPAGAGTAGLMGTTPQYSSLREIGAGMLGRGESWAAASPEEQAVGRLDTLIEETQRGTEVNERIERKIDVTTRF